MEINLNQLRSFYMAAKYGSITVAAEKMFVSPPAITMQIKRLESRLGFQLLCRDHKKIEVAKGALEIYNHADSIFSRVERFEVYLDKFVKAREGEVLVGAHHLVARHIMPNLLDRLKKKLPQFEIKIIPSNPSEHIDKLLKREVQIIVSVNRLQHETIKTIPLFSEDIILVAASKSRYISGEKMSLDELDNIPLLRQEHGSKVYQIVKKLLEKAGVSPEIAMDNLNGDVLMKFVLKDTGVAFAPRFVAQESIKKGLLQEVQVVESIPQAQVGFSFLIDPNISPKFQFFLLQLEQTDFNRSMLV